MKIFGRVILHQNRINADKSSVTNMRKLHFCLLGGQYVYLDNDEIKNLSQCFRNRFLSTGAGTNIFASQHDARAPTLLKNSHHALQTLAMLPHILKKSELPQNRSL